MKNKKSSNLSAEKKKLGILIACMVLTIAAGYLILSAVVGNTSFSSTQYEPFAEPVYGSVFTPLAGYQLYRQVGPRHFDEVTDEPFGGHVFKAAMQNDMVFWQGNLNRIWGWVYARDLDPVWHLMADEGIDNYARLSAMEKLLTEMTQQYPHGKLVYVYAFDGVTILDLTFVNGIPRGLLLPYPFPTIEELATVQGMTIPTPNIDAKTYAERWRD